MTQHSFRTTEEDEKLNDFLQDLKDKNELNIFIKNLLQSHIEGKLINLTTEEAEYLKWKIHDKKYSALIKQKHFLFMDTFNNEPSNQAKKVLETNVKQSIENYKYPQRNEKFEISYYDEKNSRLICSQCQEKFEWSRYSISEKARQKELFFDHLIIIHNKEPEPIMVEELSTI